jgi:F0F1-type ATP synthase assembly protein I
MEELPDDIKKLDERIKNFQQHTKNIEHAPKSQMRVALEGMFRLATEFVSPVLIALCIGYLADDVFSTKPSCVLIHSRLEETYLVVG